MWLRQSRKVSATCSESVECVFRPGKGTTNAVFELRQIESKRAKANPGLCGKWTLKHDVCVGWNYFKHLLIDCNFNSICDVITLALQ